MIAPSDRRRVVAYTVAGMTAIVTVVLGAGGTDVQPIAIPLVFGLAIAAAIDPDRWVAHALIVVVIVIGAELVARGVTGGLFGGDGRAVVPALMVAVVGAAVVRLACRSAT